MRQEITERAPDEPTRITVVLVDDHLVVREGVRAMLETYPGIEVVGEAEDGISAIACVERLRPDIVLMDVRMPGMGGLDAARRIKELYKDTAVIMMSSYGDDAFVTSAVCAGAAGYLLKDCSRDLLYHTIVAVCHGNIVVRDAVIRRALGDEALAATNSEGKSIVDLTERERMVLSQLVEGKTNRCIGDELGLAEVTVKKHVQSIIGKFGARDRTHVAVLAMRVGMVE
jgi:DNA-binding NarL/FixJ family response regulator